MLYGVCPSTKTDSTARAFFKHALESHIADLKKEGEQLERIQKQDEFANKLEYIACMEKNPEQKGLLLLVTGHGETDFQQSIDLLEMTFATNLLGPALLISLLLDVLPKANSPVILNACSTNIKHFYDDRRKIDFKALCGQSDMTKKYHSYQLYEDSKMGLLIATFAMAQEYKSYGICVNAIMIPATKVKLFQ